MFQPVFVYSTRGVQSNLLARLREMGFSLVDIGYVNDTSKMEWMNPAVIVYDQAAHNVLLQSEKWHMRQYLPPRHSGVIILGKKNKGYIRCLPNPRMAIEAITGRPVTKYNRVTGNFELATV